MNARATELKEYKNLQRGKNWSIYFDHQMGRTEMHEIFDDRDLDFLVWSRCRKDGITVAWCQTKRPVWRWIVEGWFPGNGWIGSTTAHEEYQAWFKLHTDCFHYAGEYKGEASTQKVPGRRVISEICEAAAAMSMCDETDPANDDDPTDVESLQRTYGTYF